MDIDAIPEEVGGYRKIITKALENLGSKNKNIVATVYVYQGPSINFSRETWSAFFGVDGDKKTLDAILSAFKSIGINNAKFSDHIDPRASTKDFHLQDGQVWLPLEPGVWLSEQHEIFMRDRDVEASIENDESIELNEMNHSSNSPDQGCDYSAKIDDTVTDVRRKIEVLFSLPYGSVSLCDPTGKALRGNAKIETLWRRWGH